MNKVIFKYTIGNEPGIGSFSMPKGAAFLHAAEQRGQLQVWMEFDQKEETTELVRFEVVFTGEPFYKSAYHKYHRTVLMFGGTLVVHIYQII